MTDSPFIVRCDACREIHLADDSHVGHYIRCAKCARLIKIVAPSSTASPDAWPDRLPATYPSSSPVAPPRPPSAARRNGVRKAVATVAVVALVIVGFAALYSFWRRAATPKGNESISRTTPSPAQSPTIQEPITIAPPTISQTPAFVELPREPVRPANGKMLAPPRGPRGGRYLRVVNDTDSDAAIKLMAEQSGKTHRFFYVRAGEQATVKGIPASSYVMLVHFGSDWDEELGEFRYGAVFQEVENPFDFRRTNWTFYLQPRVDGDTRTYPADRDKFKSGDGDDTQ